MRSPVPLSACCLGVLLRLGVFISFGSSFFLLLLLVMDWVLTVTGVVVFCSVVVWGIELVRVVRWRLWDS